MSKQAELPTDIINFVSDSGKSKVNGQDSWPEFLNIHFTKENEVLAAIEDLKIQLEKQTALEQKSIILRIKGNSERKSIRPVINQ